METKIIHIFDPSKFFCTFFLKKIIYFFCTNIFLFHGLFLYLRRETILNVKYCYYGKTKKNNAKLQGVTA